MIRLLSSQPSSAFVAAVALGATAITSNVLAGEQMTTTVTMNNSIGSGYPSLYLVTAEPVQTPTPATPSPSARQTSDAYPDFYETNLDERGSAILGQNGTTDIWRVALPALADNSEGWLGTVSILVETKVPNYRYKLTTQGQRDGKIVRLSTPDGNAIIARAADDPDRPLEALIVTIESEEPAGSSTSYDILVYGEG